MKKLLLAGGAVSALLLGLAHYSLTPDAKPVTTTGATTAKATGPADLAFHWSPNHTYEYRLHYGSETKAVPIVGDNQVGQTITGGLDLEGRLDIHAFSDDGTTATLSYALVDCKGHFNVAGQPAWSDCHEVFDGKELLVRVNHYGKVVSVHAPAGGATMFEYAMRAIIEETQVQLSEVPGIRAWVEAELLPQGTVESVYQRDADNAQALVRKRARYNALGAATMLNGASLEQQEAAKHVIELDGGVLGRVKGEEKLVATSQGRALVDSKTELELQKTGEREDDRGAIDLSKFTSRRLDDVPESTSMKQRMLEQRAAGLSWTQALETLNVHGDAGKVPDHGRFLWRTTALLELDPKRAFELIPVFEHGRAGGSLRPLVLDLLASVDTPEAQKAMRQILAGDVAKGDPRATQLLQRVGFIDHPDRDTVLFMKDRYASAKTAKNKNDRLASAYTLASVASHTDDKAANRDVVDSLTKELKNAPADETVLYLNALANTASPLAFGTFQSYATSPDPQVRAAVADALHDPPLPQSLEVLMSLVADADKDVQARAIYGLRSYQVDAKVMFRLAEIANDGKILPTNVRHLLDVVKSYRFVWKAEEEALLRALLAHEIDDVLVRAAAQQLLDASRREEK